MEQAENYEKIAVQLQNDGLLDELAHKKTMEDVQYWYGLEIKCLFNRRIDIDILESYRERMTALLGNDLDA